MQEALQQAVAWLREADAVIAAAGAGMGVDGGLPDFRGPEGFWNAFPPARALGVSFAELADPRWFEEDPALAWSFYGWRLAQYRSLPPHDGYRILHDFTQRARHGGFAFTSNVDGHFLRAGFAEERVFEVHGSLHHLQCLRDCGVGILDAAPFPMAVDEARFTLVTPLPKCPACGALLRPNVLMFGDFGWDPARAVVQERALHAWRDALPKGAKLVVIECGAGTAIPSVRRFSEACVRDGAKLVRINLREPAVPRGQLGLAQGALAALRALAAG